MLWLRAFCLSPDIRACFSKKWLKPIEAVRVGRIRYEAPIASTAGISLATLAPSLNCSMPESLAFVWFFTSSAVRNS